MRFRVIDMNAGVTDESLSQMLNKSCTINEKRTVITVENGEVSDGNKLEDQGIIVGPLLPKFKVTQSTGNLTSERIAGILGKRIFFYRSETEGDPPIIEVEDGEPVDVINKLAAERILVEEIFDEE